jgi:hypothetical protein
MAQMEEHIRSHEARSYPLLKDQLICKNPDKEDAIREYFGSLAHEFSARPAPYRPPAVTSSPVAVSLPCPVCPRNSFPDQKALASHVITKHVDKESVAREFFEDGTMKCRLCKAQVKGITDHIAEKHPKEALLFFEKSRAASAAPPAEKPSDAKVAAPPEKPPEVEGESPLFWQTVASIEHGLAEHVRYSSDEKAIVCACGEKFPNIGDFFLHCWERHPPESPPGK